MNWIESIQQAINYIEDNLTTDIDYSMLAKKVCASPFHLQRTFSLLCGLSVGEYIRKRRLSLAGEELLNSNIKILDVALKYGYESSESFSRAFSKFHGFNPTAVKKGANIQSFSRLSVKLIISGGSTMEYRIETLNEFYIACKRKKVLRPKDASPEDIHVFWDTCVKDGSIEKIVSLLNKETRLQGLLGVSFSDAKKDIHMPYAIGVECRKNTLLDEDLALVRIPSNTYAVFTCRGPMPQAFEKTMVQIVSEFFPQNPKYEYASSIDMELYPSNDIHASDYACEIWIAVKEK